MKKKNLHYILVVTTIDIGSIDVIGHITGRDMRSTSTMLEMFMIMKITCDKYYAPRFYLHFDLCWILTALRN